MVSMNGKGKEAIRAAMPQTAGFLDELRAAMDAQIPGSSAGANRNMARAMRGERGVFHFTETGADSVEYSVGAK